MPVLHVQTSDTHIKRSEYPYLTCISFIDFKLILQEVQFQNFLAIKNHPLSLWFNMSRWTRTTERLER